MTSIIYSLISIICGAVICFAGYKLFRVALSLIGAVIGARLGYCLYDITGNIFSDYLSDELTMGIYMILLAAILGFSAFALYMKALVVLMVIVGAWWFYQDFSGLKSSLGEYEGITAIAVGAGIGLVIGLAVYFLQKWAIMAVTSVLGAKIMTMTILPVISSVLLSENLTKSLFEGAKSSNFILLSTGLLIIFAVCGFINQFKAANFQVKCNHSK